ncbi:MAG TPA: endonuclease/exonuclease/phosphatase family protein [Terriglobales bacterium]|jgi:endonuclease/exonuclease/phosphatase family metal-dependent hydrolase|nr:endonuclease/exonuclease/phosphatase family protein [Terriglobales bacterium]
MSFQLRIATYNIHKCRGLDQRTRPDRIARVIAELDADIIAIQEVLDVHNGRTEFDQVRRIQFLLNGHEICFGENRSLHGGRYGNLTLSRFPVKVCENYDITWRHRERRGCLRSDLVLPGGTVLHVFNVHLGTSFIERRHQARLLLGVDVLNRHEYAGPKIVVGDFNEWTHGLASRLMGEAFEAAQRRRLLRYPRTYPGVFPVLHLDHFYYDSHLRLTSVRVHRSRTALLASDHLPLVATFEM